MKQKFSVKKVFIQGVYDPRINQGMWLSLATGLLFFIFFLCGYAGLAVFSILAILPSLLAGIDQPGPKCPLRLFKIAFLFFVSALTVLLLGRLGIPLALLFFPLTFVFAMFAVYGNEAGRVGTGAMVVAALSLSWPLVASVWLFPLLISFGTLWYGFCARLWMIWWGHRMLRETLARLFTAIGNYYVLKTRLLVRKADREEFEAVYKQQEKVYQLINQGKAYLNRYGEEGYNEELKELKRAFLLGVDIMELLQANQHKLEEMREFITASDLGHQLSDVSMAVVARLKKKSFAIRTRRKVTLKMNKQLTVFKEAVLAGNETDSPFVHSLVLQIQALTTLLATQQPAFGRVLAVPQAGEGVVATFTPHFTFTSPVFRYALRLSVTISCGVLLANWLELDKCYWVILAILLVMQSGYLLTRTLISQRVLGTLAGVVLGLLLIELPVGRNLLLAVGVVLALFSFCMIVHHKTWSIIGVTALVVLAYQIAYGRGEEVVYVRFVDSLLGCGLAFASNVLLWPQWNGGGMKRLVKETLFAQEDILILCIRALSDKDIRYEQLTRRRLKLYTAQNNLLASYQQMLREPQHTRDYVKTVDRVLSHFVATAAHINALLPMIRNSDPISANLTRHMERAVTAMFGCCDKESDEGTVDLMAELKIVYTKLEQLKKTDKDLEHFAIIHLLELIYERLSAIFQILDFCNPVELPEQKWL